MLAIDIKNAYENLSMFKMDQNERHLPPKMELYIIRNLKNLKDAAEDIETARVEICNRFAKKDDEGNAVLNDREEYIIEDVTEFNKEMSELLSSEIDVKLMLLDSDVIENYDDDKYDNLSMDDLLKIECMIE